MANYPGSYPTFPVPTSGDKLNSPDHIAQHVQEDGEILAVEQTLGLNPQGSDATVLARLNRIDPLATNAVPSTRTVNGHPLSSNITITASDVGSVPTSTTINGYPLSSNITLTKTDIGLSNVTNDIQIKVSDYTAKGIILVGTGSATYSGLPVGTDGFVLTADSAQASGVKWAAVTGTGTVTSVSVVSANGFAGSVANSTTTPAITVTTTITGILKGNGTSISAATPGTDYLNPSSNLDASKINTGTVPYANSYALAMRIGHTYAIYGSVSVPAGDTDFIIPFFVSLRTGQTATIIKARYIINSGTSVTCKLQRNGSDITGYTGISATTTVGETVQTQALSDNDKLALVVTAVSGSPKNMTFTIFIEYTGA